MQQMKQKASYEQTLYEVGASDLQLSFNIFR